MTTQHTQGPWIAGDDDDSDFFLVGPHEDGLVTQPIVRLHNEANALLIAAAPDLLEVLQEIMSWEENAQMTWAQKANAAIAKAIGETK